MLTEFGFTLPVLCVISCLLITIDCVNSIKTCPLSSLPKRTSVHVESRSLSSPLIQRKVFTYYNIPLTSSSLSKPALSSSRRSFPLIAYLKQPSSLHFQLPLQYQYQLQEQAHLLRKQPRKRQIQVQSSRLSKTKTKFQMTFLASTTSSSFVQNTVSTSSLSLSAINSDDDAKPNNENIQNTISKDNSIEIGCTVQSIAPLFDVFLIDQWGVMHDGINAYPGAIDCIEKLAQLGKSIILLSNSSKRNVSSSQRLEQMGFNPNHFIQVVTSGELTWQALNGRSDDLKRSLPFPLTEEDSDSKENPKQNESEMESKPAQIQNFSTAESIGEIQGSNCVVFGNGNDDDEYVTSMKCNFVSVENADFLLARGTFHILDGSEESWKMKYSVADPLHLSSTCQSILHKAKRRGLPMIVSNPDYMRPGDNEPMPGRVGKEYEKIGGKVIYIGKPFSIVYKHCLELLSSHHFKANENQDQDECRKVEDLKICAIGDSYHHDIEGAHRHNYQSAFITDGVHAGDLNIKEMSGVIPTEEKLIEFLQGFDFRPTYIVRRFTW